MRNCVRCWTTVPSANPPTDMARMHNAPTDPLMTPGDNDREALSALFDGELAADAARFAQRRLLHDDRWRDACGRWQLAGDVLRRRADAVAPISFADRVARALADEAAAGQALAPAVPVSRRSRRRWVPGAALAASVAVAALFVARPLSNPDAPDGGSAVPPQVATTAPAGTDAGDGTPSGADVAAAAAAAAVAVAEVPRRSGERASRGQSQRAAVRATRREATARTVAAAALPAEPATAMTAPAYASADAPDSRARARDPFLPDQAAADDTAKPWPRAVLPGYGGPSGYTVGYGEPVPVTPSFYPFEPRLPEDEGEDASPAAGSPPPGG